MKFFKIYYGLIVLLILPDAWPDEASVPNTDLSMGAGANSTPYGRISVTRHPLSQNVTVITGQPLPGAINMSYADGHAGKLPLQQVKTVLWYQGFVPSGDPWQ